MAKWTVQELIDGEYTLTAYCQNWRCHHNAKLDLFKLREKLGSDGSTMHDDLVPKLRCEKCQGKEIGLTLHPPDRPGNSFEEGMYRK